MVGIKIAYEIVVEKSGGKRPSGRFRHKQEGNI
jgi:hypothetical protein